MNPVALTPKQVRLRLKEPSGWFAAGIPFHRAMAELSDGAFKLFAYLCLQADRPTGRLEATYQRLATVLGKSKRAVGSYVQELERKGVCQVFGGRNQYAPSRFQICDSYWPYHRLEGTPENSLALVASARLSSPKSEQAAYVTAVKECFLDLGCGHGTFSPADVRKAKQFHQRGIPLSVVQDALLVGACRKYLSWLNGGSVELIGSLRYFEPLLEEIQQQPLTSDYREYLRLKNQQLQASWDETVKSRKQPQNGGYPDMDSPEIVQ